VARKHIPFALVYDFDGTLAPGNMQERDFIPSIGMTTSAFWAEVKARSVENHADNILIYMQLMLEKAQASHIPVRRSDIESYGSGLKLFSGLSPTGRGDEFQPGWFERISTYGRNSGIDVQHYIVSSGLREMISGTAIGSKFKYIFASGFLYDHNGVASWPALAVNYTTKTQYLFRINKGSLEVHDDSIINRFIPKTERYIPFEHMVFIGDGDTDIPCFRLVKEQNGHALGVYAPRQPGAKAKREQLLADGRVHAIAPADYREGQRLDLLVKAILDKVQVDEHLRAIR
tara:strand:- start:191 stop:1054 length:864 start_codon:yes stop_codon:yes gene_type:complete